MMELMFWFFFILIIYVQFGYLLILKIFKLFFYKKKGFKKECENGYFPSVSIIMLAYNEQDRIAKWFNNILSLDYPRDKLEIIVASDGSSDRTVKEARCFQADNIIIMDFKRNRGRALCHNDTIAAANNEIIITTDVDTEFFPQTIQKLVRHLQDSKIGGVIGKLQYRKKETSSSSFESLYLRFETAIKAEESRLGLLSVGMGCCLCIRKSLYVQLEANQDIDNVYPLFALKKGYRIIFEPDARVTDTAPSNIRSEFRARIRIAARSFKDNLKSWSLKDCFKYPLISWSIFSHRILRWMTPFMLMGLIITNSLIINKGTLYLYLFGLQTLFYILVIIGAIANSFELDIPLLSQIFVFFVANVGIGIGILIALFSNPPSTYIPAR